MCGENKQYLCKTTCCSPYHGLQTDESENEQPSHATLLHKYMILHTTHLAYW